MKRILSVLIILVLVTGCVFASDFHFVFDRIQLNPTVLHGFCPVSLTAGVGYTGVNFVPDSTTEFQLIAGGGYINRALYSSYDPKDIGESFDYFGQSFNIKQIMGRFSFLQGFNSDRYTVYGKYEIRKETYALYKDAISLYVGPDFAEEGVLSNTFTFGARLNAVKDTWFTKDGVKAKLEFSFSPAKKRGLSFFGAESELAYYKTLFQACRNDGSNKFSIVLVDRANLGFMTAFANSEVPIFAQEFHSLGRKVRGFETYTFSRTFTAVNNLELRFASPAIFNGKVFARLIPFVDVGVAAGSWLNEESNSNNGASFLASTGATAEISIFDFVNVGATFSYLLKGVNTNVDRAFKNSNFKMHIIFFLDY